MPQPDILTSCTGDMRYCTSEHNSELTGLHQWLSSNLSRILSAGALNHVPILSSILRRASHFLSLVVGCALVTELLIVLLRLVVLLVLLLVVVLLWLGLLALEGALVHCVQAAQTAANAEAATQRKGEEEQLLWGCQVLVAAAAVGAAAADGRAAVGAARADARTRSIRTAQTGCHGATGGRPAELPLVPHDGRDPWVDPGIAATLHLYHLVCGACAQGLLVDARHALALYVCHVHRLELILARNAVWQKACVDFNTRKGCTSCDADETRHLVLPGNSGAERLAIRERLPGLIGRLEP